MGSKLGTNDNVEGTAKTIRRKGQEGELKNLEFNVQYDENVIGAAKVYQ